MTGDDAVSATVAPTVASIFRDHGAFVWRSLRYLGVRDADVDDLTQEVFVIVHRKLPEYEGRGTIRSWLYSICVRAAHGWRRRPAVKRELPTAPVPEQPSAATAADDAAEASQLRHRLRDALLALDEAKRSVFVLYEIEQMPMAEIAASVGVPLQTAYSRLHAARRELFRVYGEAEVA